MKQIVQNYRTGELKIEEVPLPALRKGGVLVRTAYSLISAGTERDTRNIAKKSLLGKAQSRPDLVYKVLDTVKKEGIQKTHQIVSDRLNTPVPLGYSLAGEIIETAPDVAGLAVGDRVACAGAGYANHAEIVFVPKHLCARVPNDVSLKHAAFSTLGAIALHSVRQASLSIGDRVGIIGMGLLGLLTLQICTSSGCSVVGIDLKEDPLHSARKMGAELALARNDHDLERKINLFTQGTGLDRVIVAAGTESKDPFLLSSEILRDRGLLVILGGIRMEVVRTISSRFYEKEIEIRFARSYGPGRYDPNYEEKGADYPIGYVRWTEQRNLSCFLELVEKGNVQIDPLVSHVFPIKEAEEAYGLIEQNTEGCCGVLLSYPEMTPETDPVPAPGQRTVVPQTMRNEVGIGMIGAGNFARSNLLPHLGNDKRVRLEALMTSTGISAQRTARRFSFLRCLTSAEELVADPQCNLVLIATRHDSHAHYVQMGLQQNKVVYVEKPLAVSFEQLQKTWEISRTSSGCFLVGYNRRFAPLVQSLKNFFQGNTTPLTILYRVNAGNIQSDHWYQDPEQGGRIVGEGCHFVDVCQFLSGSEPQRVFCCGVQDRGKSIQNQDNVSITVWFGDGSVGVIHYLSEGSPVMPKERIEVFGGNTCAVLDDFRALTFYSHRKKKTERHSRQDKGHAREMGALVEFAQGRTPPLIPEESLFLTSLTTLRAIDSLRSGLPQDVSLSLLESKG